VSPGDRDAERLPGCPVHPVGLDRGKEKIDDDDIGWM
jgi:hypothetical protein